MTTRIASPIDTLTPRQLELVAEYASGLSLEEIAQVKFLTYTGVRNTLALAKERTGAKSLAQLCVLCLEYGVIKRNGTPGRYVPVQDEGVRG